MRVRIPIATVMLATSLLQGCAANPRPKPRVAPTTAAAARPPVCADFSFPIYFELNSGQLNPAARAVLQDAADRSRGCLVGRVEVLGLSDSSGSASANMAVSRRRAGAVADALAAAGLPRPSFQVGAAGAIGALTPDGLPEPLRRRVEVVVRASPPAARPGGTAASGPEPAFPPPATTR